MTACNRVELKSPVVTLEFHNIILFITKDTARVL